MPGPLAKDTKLAQESEVRRVWDIPTRVFHWALVVLVAVGWYLGEYRSFSTIDLHFYAGYGIGGLLVFRLVWGFFGAPASRWKNFSIGPRAVFSYIRSLSSRKPSLSYGHNPLGALAVIALIAILSAQVMTGLFAEDDTMWVKGPFVDWLASEWSIWMTAWHHYLSRALLALIGLHISVMIFYHVWKRENLVRPMISGWKVVRKQQEDS